MPMNIDDDRFDPIVTEGHHPRRLRDLEPTPESDVEGIAGGVKIIAYAEGSGMTYEQTEPVGENHHRYLNKGSSRLETVRPS